MISETPTRPDDAPRPDEALRPDSVSSRRDAAHARIAEALSRLEEIDGATMAMDAPDVMPSPHAAERHAAIDEALDVVDAAIAMLERGAAADRSVERG